MGVDSDKSNSMKKRGKVSWLLLLALALSPITVLAASSVVIKRPTSEALNQPFQMRTATRPHRGHDYNVGCGTTINTESPVKCYTGSGWGSYAVADHGCGVTTLYAHLNSCKAGMTSVVSGGARGSPGAGNSEGCHLHYEVSINGSQVNPSSAFGKDLCDPAVQKQLLEEAQNILGKYAGGGGAATGTPVNETPTGGTSTPPSSTPSGVDSVVYVPGATVTNPGRGYYVVTDLNGHQHIELDFAGEDFETPLLGPTTEDVVSKGETDNAITGCATDTWTAMVNQAVLQTRREMLINERYIAKGDSVMAYSCLSEQLLQVGDEAGPIFNESKMWANKQINILNGEKVTVNVDMGEYALDGALVNVAMGPYEAYLQTFFNHDFLGGIADMEHTDGGGHEDHAHGTSQEHAPCGIMSQVWQMAKCMDASDDPLFPKFEELISKDPRIYPGNYSCNNTGITQNMIDIARNKQAKFDKIDPYLDIIYPNEEGKCAAPIYTGVTVERYEGAGQISTKQTHLDGLCVTIGCSYQKTGGGGECVVASP